MLAEGEERSDEHVHEEPRIPNAVVRIAKQRAESGAKFLDKTRPGWARRVRVTQLDITSRDMCILGQVYGNYVDATDKLNLSDRVADSKGFNTVYVGDYDAQNPLEAAWKDEIRKRVRK